jgi:release factor glutamine methyltransferase
LKLKVEATAARRTAVATVAERLARAGVEDPAREAALLVRRAAGLSAAALIAAPEATIGAAAARVEAFAQRRETGEPLSRIEGRREFWGLDFAVTPDVLDPRADTETLVEAALSGFSARREEALRVVDFGVGSGAILAALLSEWPKATGLGVDASPAAAQVAALNLAAFGERAAVRVGVWGQGLDGRFDVIVSNPPYIRTADIAGLAREVRFHDPALALDGGPDGLDAYRALAPDIARLLAPQGRVFVEIGAGQGDAVAEIFADAGLAVDVRRRDLSGVERVLGSLRARPFRGQ